MLVVLLLGVAFVAVGVSGVGPVPDAAPAAAEGGTGCGPILCPPDEPPPVEPQPTVRIQEWYADPGTGVWVPSANGFPSMGVAGEEHRFRGYLEDPRGEVVEDAEVEMRVGGDCDAVAAAPAPLPVGGQILVRLRTGVNPSLCTVIVTVDHDGTRYIELWRTTVVQLSPQLTWITQEGVPFTPTGGDLGTVYVGDSRVFGLHTNDTEAVLTVDAAGPCTVEPLGEQSGGTRSFRVHGGPAEGTCVLTASSARNPETSYDPYTAEQLVAWLTVGPSIWFGWVPGSEPPVAFTYPGDPVPVWASVGGNLTSVNITAGGACTVQFPAIYGADPWVVTPTGIGDCVLTMTALIIDIDDPENSFPTKVFTIPVHAPAPPNHPPVAAFDVSQPTSSAPSTVNLDAASSSDPDGDELTYAWSFGNGQGGAESTAVATYPTAGSYTVTLTVMDPSGATDTATHVITVADATAPLIVPVDEGTVGPEGWYVSDATITWHVVDAESAVTSTTGCDVVTLDEDTGPDGTTYTCTATSAGGTASRSITVGRDTTPPLLAATVTPTTVALGGSATALPDATDAGSGVATASCEPVDTSSPGAHTVTCVATDVVGNNAEATVAYTVVLPTVHPGTDDPLGTQTSDLCDPAPPSGFVDVPTDNVHRTSIDCTAWLGLTTGGPEGRPANQYAPDLLVSRGQMASFLARVIALTGVALPANPPDAFADDDGSAHEHAIDQLAALGIVDGTRDDTYAPSELVRRDQLATLLANTYRVVSGGVGLPAGSDAFGDDDGNVHAGDIDALARAGLTAGTAPGTFSPGAPLRRDQMATFLTNLLRLLDADGLLAG